MATQRIYYGSGVWVPENAKVKELLTAKGIAREGRSSDWLVLAGSVSCYRDKLVESLEYLSEFYAHVFFVFSNMDFSLNGDDYLEYISSVKSELREYSNVHVLDNDLVEVGGFRVAGSSAWYYLADNYSKAYWDTFSLDKTNVHSSWKESNEHSDRDADFLSGLKNKNIDLLITYFPPCEYVDFDEMCNTACANLRGVFIPEEIPWIAGIDSFYEEGMSPVRPYTVFQANMLSGAYDLPYLELNKIERNS
jgi:hypothetical protein